MRNYDITQPAEKIDISENLIIAGLQTGEIYLFDIRVKELVWQEKIGNSIIRDLKFSPNPKDSFTFATVYNDKISLWDCKKFRTVSTMSAHNSDILSIEWSNCGRKLISGGMDRRLKIWDLNFEIIENKKFFSSISYLKFCNFRGKDLIGVAGYSSNNLFVSLWNFPDISKPVYTVKGSNITPIMKFDFLNKDIFTLNTGRDNIIQKLNLDSFLDKNHFVNTSISVDQKDCIASSMKSKKRNLLMINNISQYASLTQKIYPFSHIPDEVEFYHDMVMDHKHLNFEEQLKNYSRIVKTKNKVVGEKIYFIYKLYKAFIENKNNLKYFFELKDFKEDFLKYFDEYYKENKQEFIHDSNSGSIQILNKSNLPKTDPKSNEQTKKPQKKSKKDLYLDHSIQQKITNYLNTQQKDFFTNNKKFLSQIFLKIIQELIDQGQTLGYVLYYTLKDIIQIDNKRAIIWEHTYIHILRDQGLYVFASEMIKNSNFWIINDINNNYTKFTLRCGKCRAPLESKQNGVCDNCNEFVKCNVCDKQVKGLLLICDFCGHGGHFKEIKEMFNKKNQNVFCPEGCDHRCFYFD